MIRKFCLCFSLILMVMLSGCGKNEAQNKGASDLEKGISETGNSSRHGQSADKEELSSKASGRTDSEEESAIFRFDDCLLMKNRGLVVVGNAKGTLRTGDFVLLETEDGLCPAKVTAIEQGRNLISSVGENDGRAGVLLNGIVAKEVKDKMGSSSGSLFRYDETKIQTDYLDTKKAGELGLKEAPDLESFTTKDEMKISFHKLSPSSFLNADYDADTMEIDTIYTYSPDGSQVDLDSKTYISFQQITENPEDWEAFTERCKKAYPSIEKFQLRTINSNGFDYLVFGESKDYYYEFVYAMDLDYSVLLTVSKEEMTEEQRERAICEFHHMIKTMQFDTSERDLD